MNKKETNKIPLEHFFESIPPGEEKQISTPIGRKGLSGPYYLPTPVIQLHCPDETCNGIRFFELISDRSYLSEGQKKNVFAVYLCRNCHKSIKEFALSVLLYADETYELYKFGENPPFGPPIPARVVTLIGPDKDFLFKGRRSENQGLGIAAFAYYRRIVENQKNRILNELVRVVEKIGSHEKLIDELKAAIIETQFSNAVDHIKHNLPDILLIEGRNPLTLLHSALSQGLHARSDEECLSLATSIRMVLYELAERISQALKENYELKNAISSLLNRKKNE